MAEMTKQKYLVCQLEDWMKIHDKSADDMAHLMGISRSAWYRRLKDPGQFTMKELEMLERVTKREFLRGEKKCEDMDIETLRKSLLALLRVC